MIYISVEDFLEKTKHCARMSRQDEMECAKQMKNGDSSARERLIESYMFMVIATVKRAPARLQTLGLVYFCLKELEKAVDKFDFLQERETFVHRLSWHMRQTMTRYLAERYKTEDGQ